MRSDDKFMRMAVGLAKKAQGLTHPNPTVGAVVVKAGRVVGRGYHASCGTTHAEVNALDQAGRYAKGADIYVTLEPCDHFGRTPPCTDSIIASGIKRVIIGTRDPNPITNGAGIRKLKRHGIETRLGVLEEEAKSLNKPYAKFIKARMPYVTVKVAQSLDGKIATRTGDSRWITSDDSRRWVHTLRSRVDAVMVGANTAVRDDPLLLSNIPGAKQPVRIVVDDRLKVLPGARIFSDIDRSEVIIATTENAPISRSRLYEAKGATVLRLKSKKGRVDLKALFKRLGELEIVHVLVEGGGELIAGLIEEGLADRFLFFVAPKIIGGRLAKTAVEGSGAGRVRDALVLRNFKAKRFEDDILLEAEVG